MNAPITTTTKCVYIHKTSTPKQYNLMHNWAENVVCVCVTFEMRLEFTQISIEIVAQYLTSKQANKWTTQFLVCMIFTHSHTHTAQMASQFIDVIHILHVMRKHLCRVDMVFVCFFFSYENNHQLLVFARSSSIWSWSFNKTNDRKWSGVQIFG